MKKTPKPIPGAVENGSSSWTTQQTHGHREKEGKNRDEEGTKK
jgi:hypothetical protein